MQKIRNQEDCSFRTKISAHQTGSNDSGFHSTLIHGRIGQGYKVYLVNILAANQEFFNKYGLFSGGRFAVEGTISMTL